MNRKWMATLAIVTLLAACRWPPFGDERASKRSDKPAAGDAAEGTLAPAATPASQSQAGEAAGAPAETSGERPVVAEATPEPTPKPTPPPVRVPAGTAMPVALTADLSSATNPTGDAVRATLADNVVVKGRTVLRRGCELRGRVVEARRAGRTKGKGYLAFVLDEIVVNGRTYSIDTGTFSRAARGSKNKDAAMIGGGAGAGALVGAIVGGKKGAAIGGAVGAGAGAGAAMSTRGEEAIFPAGQQLQVTLQSTLVLR